MIAVFLNECLQAVMNLQIHILPVIKSSSSYRLVVNIETQRAHQVKSGIGGRTGSGNIARVGWYLRFYEYDMKHRIPLIHKVLQYDNSFGLLFQLKFVSDRYPAPDIFHILAFSLYSNSVHGKSRGDVHVSSALAVSAPSTVSLSSVHPLNPPYRSGS